MDIYELFQSIECYVRVKKTWAYLSILKVSSLWDMCVSSVCVTLHHSWFIKDLLSRAIALEEIKRQH